MLKRALLVLLLGGLSILLWQPVLPYWAWLPKPVSCQGREPSWLAPLKTLSDELAWPGFQLAYQNAQGERVVCAVGWAGALKPLIDQHVMRYASLSKVMTSLVVEQLFVEGKLAPEDLLLEQLQWHGEVIDPRLREITLEHLLTHTAGFDRQRSGDPMLVSEPWCSTNLTRLSEVALDHAPGDYYAYSNLGYCLLATVIERVERQPLAEVFARRLLLDGRSIRLVETGQRLPTEPQAHFSRPQTQDSLLQLDYHALRGVGAWAGTAEDLLVVLNNALSNEYVRQELLKPKAECDLSVWRKCHGRAFYSYQYGEQLMHWRDGSLPGVSAFMAVFDDGSKVVILANGRSSDWLLGSDRLGLALAQWLSR